MNIQTFEQELAALTLFTEELLASARSVGTALDDERRGKLMSELQIVHAELVPLEERRMRELAEAMEELRAFERSELKPVEEQEERREKSQKLQSLEKRMNVPSPRTDDRA